MSNNYLHTRQSFSLVLENKAIWPEYTEQLADAFSLFQRKRSHKRFIEFLESPFFIAKKDAARVPLSKLFSYLSGRIDKNPENSIRIKAILWDVYQSRDLTKDKRKLRALMKRLCKEILRFNAYEHLEEHPEEIARIETLSLRNKGLSKSYHSAQKTWKESAEALPVGTHGAFHRWAAHDAGYMGLDVPKSKFDPDAFRAMWRVLMEFVTLQQSLYEFEIARRPEIRDKLPAMTEAAEAFGYEAKLTGLYRGLVKLLETEVNNVDKYGTLKRNLLTHADKIDPEHQLAVMIGLLNHLQGLCFRGDLSLQSEMWFWPHALLRSKSHQLIPVIPKQLYHNQLQRALINNQLWLARRIRDEVLPQLPYSVIGYMEDHTRLAFDFQEKRYSEIVHSVWAYSMARYKSNNHQEIIHLKSYYIRSLLACLKEKPDDDYLHDSAIRAFKTLDKYIEAHGKEEFLGMRDRNLPYRRFRTIARLTYTYFLKDDYTKITIRDKMNQFMEDRQPLACRLWFTDFIRDLPD